MGKYALVIGNSEYQEPKLAPLVKPGQDARGLAEVLLEKEIGGFDEVKLLVNEPEVVVRRAISRFFAQKSRSDLLLLYFSGHGVLDEEGQLYFAVRDTEHDALTSTAIAAGFVRQEMNRSLSRRQVLILDCCNSGSFGKGAKAVEESVGAAANFEVAGYGRAVLTATDTIQYAWEKEQFVGDAEYSVFTHFLIEGLKTGAADNAGDADGQTALDELFDYARTQIRASNARQTPTLSVDKLTDPLIIARNPRPRAPKPVALPDELRAAIESPFSGIREGAVKELERFLDGSVPGLARAAQAALVTLKDDDSRRVATAATQILAAYADGQRRAASAEDEVKAQVAARQRDDDERIARNRADRERLAAQKGAADRLAHEQAERARLAARGQTLASAPNSWRRIALMAAGWGIAFALYARVFVRDVGSEIIVLGAAIGLITGLGLTPHFRAQHILALTLTWGIGTGMAAVSDQSGSNVVYAALGAALCCVGSGLVARWAQPSLTRKRTGLIIVGWGLAGLAGIFAGYLLNGALLHGWSSIRLPPGRDLDTILLSGFGVASGSVGNWIMQRQLRQAQMDGAN